MRSSLLRPWLMASAGVAALSAGPAFAQQDSCEQQLDQMHEELRQLAVSEQRRSDVQLVIDGARTLAETGDEEGCESVLVELDSLMQTIQGSSGQAATSEPPQSGQPGAADPSGAASAQRKQTTDGKGEQTASDVEGAAEVTAEAASPLAQIPASELLGSEVVNAEGDSLAEIVDMVKRVDSEEVLAVLSVGGFLGLGEKEVAMPLDRFQIGPDEQIVLSNATEEELEALPAWEQDDAAFEGLRP